MAALAAPPRDVLMEQLELAPRVFPLQPSPLMTPNDHSSNLSFATVAEKRVACFSIGGEPRLCFPQVISACLEDTDYLEIIRVIEDLHIHLQPASSRQLEALKLSNSLPDQAVNCGLITKTDSERLIGEVRVNLVGHDAPVGLNLHERLSIKHKCFGRCKGFVFPSLRPRPCIQCATCGRFFHPEHFTTHNHGREEILRTQHWGFDPNNWRLFLHLTKPDRDNPVKQEAFEEFLNPTTHKRSIVAEHEEGVIAKRSMDYMNALKQKEERRQSGLLLQLQQLTQFSNINAVQEATAALLKLGQPTLNAFSLSQSAVQHAAPYATPYATPQVILNAPQHATHVTQQITQPVFEPVKAENKDVQIDVVSIGEGPSGNIFGASTHKIRPESEDSGDEDTLDAQLSSLLKEPVLSSVRARIADSQRAIEQQLDEVSNERDQLKAENALLRQHYQTLFNYVQQQQQQNLNQQKQLAAAAQLQPMLALMAASANKPPPPPAPAPAPAPGPGPSSLSLSSLPNSVLLQQLMQQQQQNILQSQIQQQLSGIANQMDPSMLAALGLSAPSKAVQLPTAAQLDPLRPRLS